MIRIDFTINTLEDLHIGEGINKAGLYDDGTVKDILGNPALGSETFKGLLRQSLLEYKSNNPRVEDVETKVLYDTLFTYSVQNSMDIIIKANEESLKDENFILLSFTAIDDDTGKAKDKTLRTIECVRKGIKFDGVLFFNGDNTELRSAMTNYLRNALTDINWIGSHRRRGLGAVQIEISETPLIEFPQPPTIKDISTSELALMLELQDDVTIAGAGQFVNHYNTLDYIPGTSLLGMLRVAVGRSYPESLPLLSEDSICSNLYPIPNWIKYEDHINEGSLPFICPIPLSARQQKASDAFTSSTNTNKYPHWLLKTDKQHLLANELKGDFADTETEADSSKSFRGGYIIRENTKSEWGYYCPPLTLKLRNAIDSNTQRTGTDSLITQDCLAAGNRFLGTIRLSSKEEAKKLYNTLIKIAENNPFLHIGKGSKPVSIKAVYPVKSKISPLINPETNTIRLTCLSDVIMRDQQLQFNNCISSEYLADKLGIKGNDIKLTKQFSNTRIIHGFHGLAGIRRFGVQAICKGSVFVYECAVTEDVRKLLIELEETGIGFRTNEGYGRIAVDVSLGTKNQNSLNLDVNTEIDESKLANRFFIQYKAADSICRKIKEIEDADRVVKNLYQLLLRKTDLRTISKWLDNGASKEKSDDAKKFTHLKELFGKLDKDAHYFTNPEPINVFILALSMALPKEDSRG